MISTAKKRQAVLAKRAPIAQVRSKLTRLAKADGYTIEELFGAYGDIEVAGKRVAFRGCTPMDWVDKLRTAYLPVSGIFATLGAEQKRRLRCELLELVAKFNRATDGSMVVDASYLEVAITRR